MILLVKKSLRSLQFYPTSEYVYSAAGLILCQLWMEMNSHIDSKIVIKTKKNVNAFLT